VPIGIVTTMLSDAIHNSSISGQQSHLTEWGSKGLEMVLWEQLA